MPSTQKLEHLLTVLDDLLISRGQNPFDQDNQQDAISYLTNHGMTEQSAKKFVDEYIESGLRDGWITK